MSDLIPRTASDALEAEFASMPMEQLANLIREGLLLTVAAVSRLTCAARVYERRGGDLNKLTGFLAEHILAVVRGHLLPELMVRFLRSDHHHVRRLVPVLARLPLDEQQKLVAGERVETVVLAPDGRGYTTDKIDPLEMTPRQVRQVFARSNIRSLAAQRAIIQDRRMEAAKPIPEQVGKLKIDNERGGVVIGRHFVPWSDLETALRLKRKP